MPIRVLTVTGTEPRSPHRGHAVGDEVWPGHEGRAETPSLHPGTGASHVEVHLVVARALGEARAAGELRRVAPAELKCHRVLGGIGA